MVRSSGWGNRWDAGSLTTTVEAGGGLALPRIYRNLDSDPRRPPPEEVYTYTEEMSKIDEEKSTCLSWVKYGIFAANIVFIVVGTAIMALGAWLRTDSRFRDFLSESNSTLLSIARNTQVNDTWYMWYSAVADSIPGERRYRQVVEEAFWEAPTLYAFSYIMIVLGAAMIVVAFFGCCGVTASAKPFIGIYAVAVFVLLIATISAGLFIFYKKDGIDVELSDALTYMVQHYYQGPSIVQESLDHLQQTFRCCGNGGCGDFRIFRQDPPRSCDIRCDGCHYRIWHALTIGFSAACVVFFFVILAQVVAISLACYLLFRPRRDVRVLYISDHANAAYQSSPPSTHPQPLSHLTRENLARHNLPFALRNKARSSRMPGNRRPATSSFPSSASTAPCIIIPIDDVDDENDPASALLAATQSSSDQSEASSSPSGSAPEVSPPLNGDDLQTPYVFDDTNAMQEALLQRVQEAAETAALNAMSGRRRPDPVSYGDLEGGAVPPIRVTESMENSSESDDEETADEEEAPRDRANNVETTPEILRREFNRVRLALRQNRNAQTVASMFSKFLPFALLFLLKLCFEKSSALISIIMGYMVFLIGDKHVTSISSSQRGSIFITIWAIVGHYLALNYVIGVDIAPVLNALILHFQPYETCLVTLYFVIMSDLAAKHITILVKAVVVSIPVRTMALKRRRRLLQFLEYSSQTFRCAIAAPWWIMYFLGPFNMADSASALTYLHELPVANTLFVCAFIILKVKEIIDFGQNVYRSAVSLLNMVSYGVAPTQEEIAKHDKCSICFENLRFPIKLLCNHIFCEECAEKWLDEKHTCPMCRAQVEEQDSRFFNAATCKTVRIY